MAGYYLCELVVDECIVSFVCFAGRKRRREGTRSSSSRGGGDGGVIPFTHDIRIIFGKHKGWLN